MHIRLSNGGFSLIELITVMLLISIIAAYASSRWSGSDSTLHSQAAQLARDIRHAQALAMNRGTRLKLDLVGATTYQVTDAGVPVTDPASGDTFSRTLTNGVTRSGTCGDIDFDSLGRPVNAGALIGAACTYILNSDNASATLTLAPVSGFVAVSP